MQVQANGIPIEVEDSGGSGPAVLLVMGLGMQLIAWPDTLVRGLAQAGYRVIRHDNRDAGLSRIFDELHLPNLPWAMLSQRLGLRVNAPYTLGDMAQDALGVLDALGVARAHVLGASMGGMIAQRMAMAAPERLLSLTSAMSSSGARGLPGPTHEVAHAMLTRPPAGDRQAMLAHSVRFFRLIGGPGFVVPEDELRARVGAASAVPTTREACCGSCWPSWPTTPAPRCWRASPRPPWWSMARATRWCRCPAARTRRGASRRAAGGHRRHGARPARQRGAATAAAAAGTLCA
jgi:pimeloyl-ACP methyl ester carboxylesterase